MAQAGVPAFSVTAGMKIKGKPKDFAIKVYKEFNDKAYHSPQDELKPDWDFSGFVVLARFTLDLAREIANADRLPTWNPGDEFRPAREPTQQEKAKRSDQNTKGENQLERLKKLKITGVSLGGPYLGIVHNDVTKSIVDQGSQIIPVLVKRLDSSGYDESAYIVFCLRELRARSAIDKIVELEKSLDEGKRFVETPHDLTLKMQIKFFKRDFESWK
jgi:hypothetical protein